MQSSTTARTSLAGTADDGEVDGASGNDGDARIRRHVLIAVAVGCTAKSWPVNPDAMRLCRISAPILPRCWDAPTTATERGSKNGRIDAGRGDSARARPTARLDGRRRLESSDR